MRFATVILGLLSVMTLCGVGQSSQLSLKSVTGETVNIGEGGKVAVLSFSATWAPLASKELPALQRFADSYTARGVSVYWVSINSSKQGAKNYASDADLAAYASRSGFKASVLRDPDQSAYRSLGLSAVPTIIVLDRSGRVVLKHVGFDPDQDDPFRDIAKVVDGLIR